MYLCEAMLCNLGRFFFVDARVLGFSAQDACKMLQTFEEFL